jgi:hypothetical protein
MIAAERHQNKNTNLVKSCKMLLRLWFEFYLIHKTPHPILAWFDRLNDGVLCCAKVFCRVLVLGRIATPHVAAFAAKPQVHPGISHFQAFFASFCVRTHIFDVVGVGTDGAHTSSLVS